MNSRRCLAGYSTFALSAMSPRVQAQLWGRGTLTFADRDNGTFAYSVNASVQVEQISRYVFAAPPTVCN